jgi:hypothetical protein
LRRGETGAGDREGKHAGAHGVDESDRKKIGASLSSWLGVQAEIE